MKFALIILATAALLPAQFTAVSGMAQPVEILPPGLRGAVQPQVAVAPGGSIFVTFGKGAAIYCVGSTNGGKTFMRPVEVASLPKLALGMRRGPRIVASDTQVTISAISHEDGNLYAWTSEDGGAKWSKGVRINTIPNSAREGLHAMAGDGPKGFVYAVWLDSRKKGAQLWSAASYDHGKTWADNVLVYQSPDGHVCECCHPSATVTTNGILRVMWRNWLGGSRDMYAASSLDGGKTFSAAEKLGSGTWPLNGCPMDGGSLAGQYSTWRRKATVYYTDDRPDEHVLAEGKQPIVGLSKEGVCFLWQSGSQLMLKKGLMVNPIVLSEVGAYPAIATTPELQCPVVVWESMTNEVHTIFSQVLK